MADARTQHLLQRSVRKLAVDIVRDTRAKHERDADTVLAEREEQVQFEVSGTATPATAYTTIVIPFQQAFVVDDDRRDSQLDRPHALFGYELLGTIEAVADTGGGGGVVIGT